MSINPITRSSEEPAWRLPAEWEPVDGVLLAWPHADTDWNYMLDEVQACYVEIITNIHLHAGVKVFLIGSDLESARKKLAALPEEAIEFLPVFNNDTWTRDYGPISLANGNGRRKWLDFRFNGWGLKFACNFDNQATEKFFLLHSKLCGNSNLLFENRQPFILEGGAIDSDGKGNLLTTSECILSKNRNEFPDEASATSALKRELCVENIFWLNHGFLEGDDTDSHIDTLARFAPANTILYTSCDRNDDLHYSELKKMEEQLKSFASPEGEKYSLIPLPIPEAICRDGERLPATYANFLILNRCVFVPTYSQPHYDEMALKNISVAFPGYKIVPVDCMALIAQHGSLHCATMNLQFLP